MSHVSGLMFYRDKKKSILFVFKEEKSHPIHSFFVFYPFSAIYLDKNMKVVEKFTVKPFQMHVENKKPAKYLLESFNLKSNPRIGEELKCSGGKS